MNLGTVSKYMKQKLTREIDKFTIGDFKFLGNSKTSI